MTGLLLLGAPAATAATKKKPTTASKKKATSSKASKEAQALHDEAANLLRGKQYAEAQATAQRCIEANPEDAECHMLLAAALAGNQRVEEAAEEYRTFLRMAPDHKLAPKVRETVEKYDQAKSPSP